tara:strand:- start:579 stop:719 length:141 start_codon:yes stop_codon:yes gene_type:complete
MKAWILALGIVILWNSPKARVNTAKFLRSAADFLSTVERPTEQRSR